MYSHRVWPYRELLEIRARCVGRCSIWPFVDPLFSFLDLWSCTTEFRLAMTGCCREQNEAANTGPDYASQPYRDDCGINNPTTHAWNHVEKDKMAEPNADIQSYLPGSASLVEDLDS